MGVDCALAVVPLELLSKMYASVKNSKQGNWKTSFAVAKCYFVAKMFCFTLEVLLVVSVHVVVFFFFLINKCTELWENFGCGLCKRRVFVF